MGRLSEIVPVGRVEVGLYLNIVRPVRGRTREPFREVEREDVGPRDAFARSQAASQTFFISVRALSFPMEFFSICRMRSRVTLKIAPISSNVAGSLPSSP